MSVNNISVSNKFLTTGITQSFIFHITLELLLLLTVLHGHLSVTFKTKIRFFSLTLDISQTYLILTDSSLLPIIY